MNKNNLFELLDEKYNVQLQEYWNLPEGDKNNITNLIFSQIKPVVDKHPEAYHHFESLLLTRIIETERMEEYERSEIMKRVVELLFNHYMK